MRSNILLNRKNENFIINYDNETKKLKGVGPTLRYLYYLQFIGVSVDSNLINELEKELGRGFLTA